MGATDWYLGRVVKAHTVVFAQMRSVVYVGGVSSYWVVVLQARREAHTRLEVAVAAAVSYCSMVQAARDEHVRSCSPMQSVWTYWLAPHGVQLRHTLSASAVQGDEIIRLPGVQNVQGKHTVSVNTTVPFANTIEEQACLA